MVLLFQHQEGSCAGQFVFYNSEMCSLSADVWSI